MKKNLILVSFLCLSLLITGCNFFGQINEDLTQQVGQDTINISKEYAVLRYQTENVLENVADFPNYDAWNQEMSSVINNWHKLELTAADLEQQSQLITDTNLGYNLIEKSYAYTQEEVTNVINNAPMGKQVRTLANYLGVDAKKAQLILNETQNQISREAYGAEGDVFEKCEHNSMEIKNSCKVTVFVGAAILSGGTSTLAQTAMVVGGADLVLEVTEDDARIALGDRNKVTEFIGKVRTFTEPAASILTLVNIPGNLTKAIDKIGAVSFGADQVRSFVQNDKILGVSIKTSENNELKTEMAGLTAEELSKWMAANNIIKSGESVEEILGVKPTAVSSKEKVNDSNRTDEKTMSPETNQPPTNKSSETSSTQTIPGTYSGSATLLHIEEDVESPDSLPVTLQLNESGTGTVNVNGYGGEASFAGNNVNFSVTMEEDGATVRCVFEGTAVRNGSQTVISGNMHFSMMGITFATYGWSAQK